MPIPPQLILASTSPYRRTLLERLRIPFVVEGPGVEENAHDGESPDALAARLAELKARAVASRHPGALVLGSDQVAQLGARRLGKPGTRLAAIAQLRACSGKTVRFVTAVCLFDGRDGSLRRHLDLTLVIFRSLSDDEIDRYVDIDSPLDCAGAFRSESLGAALVERIASDDPTGLIGLPLIATAGMLREVGLVMP